MKRFRLAVIVVAFSLSCFGQEEIKYTIGLDANVLHNISPTGRMNNNFSYGFSFLMTGNMDKLKIGVGINYSPLNLTMDPDASDKREHRFKYLNIPVLIFFNNNSKKIVKISPYVGIVINKIVYYDKVVYGIYPAPFTIAQEIPTDLGFSLRAGANISKPISKHFVINAAPFADFRFVTIGYYDPHSDRMPEYFLTFGFRLGFDYFSSRIII